MVLLLLAAAGTVLGTAGRNGPTAVQGAALVVEAVAVVAIMVLGVRWVLRRHRARRSSPDGRPPSSPTYGSARWSAQRRPWALVAAPFYGLYLGWTSGAIAWWLPLAVFLGALVVGGVVRVLLRASRGRRWAAARQAHPGAAVALVAVDAFAAMRLTQWAKAAGTTVPSPGSSDAVLAADDDGVVLWRPDRPERPVHRWSWDDVELSRTSSSTDLPHLVLTLLGPLPAVRARAVPAARRRFDLSLTVRTLRPAGPEAAEVVTAAALDELVARRPDDPAASSRAATPEGADADPAAGSW